MFFLYYLTLIQNYTNCWLYENKKNNIQYYYISNKLLTITFFININSFFLFNNFFCFGITGFETFIFYKNNFIKKNILSYFIFNDSISILFSSINKTTNSLEKLLPIFKLQERELIEFFNIGFVNKFDNRSLFLWTTVGGFPLTKEFPVQGFWEISIDSALNLNYVRSSV